METTEPNSFLPVRELRISPQHVFVLHEWIRGQWFRKAVIEGHLGLVQRFEQQRSFYSAAVLRLLIKHGHVHIIKWYQSKLNLTWDGFELDLARTHNQPEVYQYFISCGQAPSCASVAWTRSNVKQQLNLVTAVLRPFILPSLPVSPHCPTQAYLALPALR